MIQIITDKHAWFDLSPIFFVGEELLAEDHLQTLFHQNLKQNDIM